MPKMLQVPSQSMKKLLEKACQNYENQMPESLAEKYLLNRGITKETQAYFRLGYVNDPSPGHEFMAGRISIPYITPTGIVQMRFRAVPDEGIPGNPEPSPKMKSETGAHSTIYNTRDLLRDDEPVCICEGESDTWTAYQIGYPTIGIPGARNWNHIYARALRYRTIVILADNDDHGEGLDFAESVQKTIPRARIILMPDGCDVNKTLQVEGAEYIRNKIGNKVNE